MVSNRLGARTEVPHSVFPAAEPASFCSRPTPVVPANPDLYADEQSADEQRTDERDSVRPAARPSVPSNSISDRPTFVPDDYIEPRRESPPSVTFGEEPPSGALLAPASPLETPGLGGRLVPPPLPIAAATPPAHAVTVRPRARSPRVLFARVLFVVLFGAVGSLLGYAFRPELAHAFGRLRGDTPKATSVK
jgi:hypothetical protein